MTSREREYQTLNFYKMEGRGSVEETFFPWDMTLDRWVKEGLPEEFASANLYKNHFEDLEHHFLWDNIADSCKNYEKHLGFDEVKRFGFYIPFNLFKEEVLEETDEYEIKLCSDGWQRKFFKNSSLVHEIRPAVENMEDWLKLKSIVEKKLESICSSTKIKKVFTPYKSDHQKGEFTVRFRFSGFFWKPRDLMGIEQHMIAFFEQPELLHAINEFVLDTYIKILSQVFDIITPDVVLICEDLSGANGPMLSPDQFDEFVGAYYKKLIPLMKEKGVRNIFVDTDGDFTVLIPNFIHAGVEGFLPMDVNAGMDIVKVRKAYPKLKFIGAYNKLCIARGKESIDKEFERLMPVIRQGGYIPGCDHQVAPSTPLENYEYYIKKLKESMKFCGKDI